MIDTVDNVRYDLNQPAKSSILFTAALKHLFGRRNILEIPHRVYEPLFWVSVIKCLTGNLREKGFDLAHGFRDYQSIVVGKV